MADATTSTAAGATGAAGASSSSTAASSSASGSTTVPTKIKGLSSIKSLIASIANVGKTSIVEGVKQLLPGGSDYLKNEQQVRNMIKVYALSSEQFIKYSASMFHTATDMGFKWGAKMEDLIKIQNDYNDEVGRNIQLTEMDYDAQLALGQVFGKTDKDVALAQKFSQGLLNYNHDIQSSVQLFDSIYKKAEGYGLNMDKIAQNITNNLVMADKFNFRNGVKGIMEMAVYAEKYRISMQSAQGIIDNFGNDFEKTIESAANLSNLGGGLQGINPVEYYRMALTDPEALVKDLSERMNGLMRFDPSTGEFNVEAMQGEMLLRNMAQFSGQDVGELRKQMRERAKRSQVESQIKNRGLTDEQMTTISSKALWDNKNGKWYVTDTSNNRVSLEDINSNNIENFMAGDRNKSIEQIGLNAQGTEMQLNNIDQGIKASIDELTNKYIGPTMRDLSVMANSMTHKFIHNMPENIRKLGNSITKFTKEIGKLGKKISQFFEGKSSLNSKNVEKTLDKTEKQSYDAVRKSTKGSNGSSGITLYEGQEAEVPLGQRHLYDENGEYDISTGEDVIKRGAGNEAEGTKSLSNGNSVPYSQIILDKDSKSGTYIQNDDYTYAIRQESLIKGLSTMLSGLNWAYNFLSGASSNGSNVSPTAPSYSSSVTNTSVVNGALNAEISEDMFNRFLSIQDGAISNIGLNSSLIPTGSNVSDNNGGDTFISNEAITPNNENLRTVIMPPAQISVLPYMERTGVAGSAQSSTYNVGSDNTIKLVAEGTINVSMPNGQTTEIPKDIMEKIYQMVLNKIRDNMNIHSYRDINNADGYSYRNEQMIHI